MNKISIDLMFFDRLEVFVAIEFSATVGDIFLSPLSPLRHDGATYIHKCYAFHRAHILIELGNNPLDRF